MNAYRTVLIAILGACTGGVCSADEAVKPIAPAPTATAAPTIAAAAHVSVLTGDQVIQILDQTVEWYRTNSAWVAAVRGGEYRSYYQKYYEDRDTVLPPMGRTTDRRPSGD